MIAEIKCHDSSSMLANGDNEEMGIWREITMQKEAETNGERENMPK